MISEEEPKMSSVWIKNPLAVYTPEGVDAGGGLVVEQKQIIELVKKDRNPVSRMKVPLMPLTMLSCLD
jgi:8-oxoguanine deaminase